MKKIINSLLFKYFTKNVTDLIREIKMNMQQPDKLFLTRIILFIKVEKLQGN